MKTIVNISEMASDHLNESDKERLSGHAEGSLVICHPFKATGKIIDDVYHVEVVHVDELVEVESPDEFDPEKIELQKKHDIVASIIALMQEKDVSINSACSLLDIDIDEWDDLVNYNVNHISIDRLSSFLDILFAYECSPE